MSPYITTSRALSFRNRNPQPVFATLNAEIVDRRNMGKAGTHMKLQLLHDGKTFDAVGFGMAQEIDAKIGDKIDIAYTIDLNEWNGRKVCN